MLAISISTITTYKQTIKGNVMNIRQLSNRFFVLSSINQFVSCRMHTSVAIRNRYCPLAFDFIYSLDQGIYKRRLLNWTWTWLYLICKTVEISKSLCELVKYGEHLFVFCVCIALNYHLCAKSALHLNISLMNEESFLTCQLLINNDNANNNNNTRMNHAARQPGRRSENNPRPYNYNL